MKTITLIMIILSGNGSRESSTVITSEFNSLYSCQQAIESVEEQIRKAQTSWVKVISRGCYEKD